MKNYECFTEIERKNLILNKETYLNSFQNYLNRDMNIIEKEIKEINFDNFDFKTDGFNIIIYPSNEFKELILKLNQFKNYNLDNNLIFELTVDKDRLNTINLDFILPKELRGLNIGYKIYKYIIDRFHFLTSDIGCSDEAKNVWYKLLCDSDYYAITCNKKNNINRGFVCIINKNITNYTLLKILDLINKNLYRLYGHVIEELNYDSEIKQKILILWK